MNIFFIAFRNLFRSTRRTLAILCTIALGTGALFSFDGFIQGVLKELKYTTIHSNYGFGQVNTEGYREKTFEDPIQHWISDPQEVTTQILQVEGVESVFPRVTFSALLKSTSATVSGSGQGIAAEQEALFFHSLNIEEGKALEKEPYGIVLGKGLADALSVKPGDRVMVMATSTKGVIQRQNFTVTGVFHTGNVEFDRRMFRIQLPSAQRLLKTDKIETISLGLARGASWSEVATKIQEKFPTLEATPFEELDKIYYQHSVDWLKAQFTVVQVIILSIVLLGIFNSISASILDRKQEIGNLRANGQSVRKVMSLIVTEGALVGFFGSALGVIFAYTVLMLFIDKGLFLPPGPGQNRQFLVTFFFSVPMVVYSITLTTLCALLAAFLASIKVATMPIAKLLRSY